MKAFADRHTEITDKTARSICALLFTRGFDATLTFFCTFCVFSVD
jgi:hypothetical protein